MNIDYKIAADAISFYESNGYKYIEAPWIVSKEALLITAPLVLNKEDMEASNPGNLVASGEQSFLEMILNNKLSEGKYCCATPCFRPFDDLKDGIHFPTFFKVELIEYIGNTQLSHQDIASKIDSMLEKAILFMENILGKESGEELVIESIIDEDRAGCSSSCCLDVVMPVTKMELGSYGFRTASKIGSWIYGTGVALPRLTIAGVK